MELEIIARVHTDFPTKFGLPRQSGLAALPAEIVFPSGMQAAFGASEPGPISG